MKPHSHIERITFARTRKGMVHDENSGRENVWVLTVADPHSANQPRYRILREHVADHAVCLALIQPASRPARDDPARVLPSVLQQRQTLAYLRRRVECGVMQEKAEYPAHCEKDGLGMRDKEKKKVDAKLSRTQAAKYEPRFLTGFPFFSRRI
jgi:hypothetical protein